MKDNDLLKFLSCIPVIILFLYFIPFLGICLLILRYFVYYGKRRIRTPFYLIFLGTFLLLPKILEFVLSIIKFDITAIPYLGDIVVSNIYNEKIINLSKTLLIIGIIYIVLSVIFNNIYSKLSSKVNSSVRNYMEQDLKKDYEIRKENDLKMHEKRESAKNTHVVKCPYCGSDNMLTEKVGTCKFCRRKIEYK